MEIVERHFAVLDGPIQENVLPQFLHEKELLLLRAHKYFEHLTNKPQMYWQKLWLS